MHHLAGSLINKLGNIFFKQALPVVLAIGWVSTPTFAAQRDPSACSDLLKPDTEAFARDVRLQIAYLETITQKQYDDAKRQGSLDALIPIQGVPVKVGSSYQDFHTSLSDYERSLHYTLDLADSTRYYSSRIPAARSHDFVECMRNQNREGLFLYAAERPTEHGDVVLALEWRPAGGGDARLKFSGENYTIKDKPTTIKANSPMELFVKRKEPSKSLVVVVNADGYAGQGDHFIDPAPPPTLISHIVRGNSHDMKDIWSQAIPGTTSDEVCSLVSAEGKWDCSTRNNCPMTCDKSVPNFSVTGNVESSGAFDAPGQYFDNTGSCRYTFRCIKPKGP